MKDAIMNLPLNPSQSTKARNPELFRDLKPEDLKSPERRIAQRAKPLMNKLEAEAFKILTIEATGQLPRAQAITFRLANGVRYTPDIFSFDWPAVGEAAGPTAWEVKGRKAWDDSIVKLKVFAASYPMIRVYLIWKEKEKWHQQRVLP
jgi:hypothetical protein